MKKILVLAALMASMCASRGLYAQTTLSVGDVYITGFNTNAPDGFGFVLLRDIAAGTDIRFTDNGFLSGASANATNNGRGGENFLRWVAPTGGLTAGTVVRWIDGTGPSVGTVPFGGLTGLSNSGDQIFIYQGNGAGTSTSTMNFGTNANPSTFTGTILNGLNSQGWLTTGGVSSNTSYLPAELVGLNRNISFGSLTAAGNYSGVRTGLTAAVYGHAISNTSNWTTATGSGTVTLTSTNFSVESSAALHWDANGTTAGNGGAGTWDTTTNNRFKNSASGSTYLSWVNSSVGNHHSAVFGGIAGTVSVASGGVTASGLDFQTDGYVIQNNTITLTGSPELNVSTGTATINSNLAGSTSVTKTGAGTLVLGGTNTYDGSTQIMNGVLVVSSTGSLGTSSASVSVGSNSEFVVNGLVDALSVAVDGKLSGNGLIDAAMITINGTLGPGNSIDELSVIGDLSFTAGSTFDVEVNSNLLSSDLLTIDGNLELGSSTLNLSDLNFLARTTGTLTIASYTGILSGDFDSLLDGSLIDVGGNIWSLSYGSRNGGAITLSAVPEPSALLLVGSIIGAGLLRRRRV